MTAAQLIGRTGTTRHGERVQIIGEARDPARVTVVPLGVDASVVEYFTPQLAHITLDDAPTFLSTPNTGLRSDR